MSAARISDRPNKCFRGDILYLREVVINVMLILFSAFHEIIISAFLGVYLYLFYILFPENLVYFYDNAEKEVLNNGSLFTFV
jgi:hypothetical protein